MKQRDAFSTAVEAYEAIGQESVNQLEMKINDKTREFDELDNTFATKWKRAQVEFELHMQEHRRRGAVDVLAKSDEVAIKASDLEDLRARVNLLEESRDADIKAAEAKVRARMDREHEMDVKQLQLEHSAESAELNAKLGQKEAEIEVLKDTIDGLKGEVASQRALTECVTDSFARASSHPPMYAAPAK